MPQAMGTAGGSVIAAKVVENLPGAAGDVADIARDVTRNPIRERVE